MRKVLYACTGEWKDIAIDASSGDGSGRYVLPPKLDVAGVGNKCSAVSR